jgi:hypothetical protein
VVIDYWAIWGPAMGATDRTRWVRFDAFDVDMRAGEVRKHGICKISPSRFNLNGTHLGLAKLHVTHSTDERGPASGP